MGLNGVVIPCYTFQEKEYEEINMAATISKKGSVTIPAELRKRYNLQAGAKVVFVDYGGRLTIIPATDDPIKKGYGFLKGKSSMAIDLRKDREQEKQRDLRLANA
jgi:AbrB family looped-hinge helix DNA binding protein